MEHQRRANRGVIPGEVQRKARKENTLQITCLLLSIAVIIGIYSMISAATSRFSWKLDLTEGQVFRLTDTTKGILSELDEPVTFTYCNDRPDADTNLQEVLSRYAAASPGIDVNYVDLDANPAMVEEYSQKDIQLSSDGILVTCGIQSRFIPWSELYEIRTSSGDENQSYSITGLKAEAMLTSAIVAVSGQDCPGVAFTAGHSEDDSETLRNLVANSNYEVSQVVLGVDELNEAVEAIIIAGAKRDFSEAELEILEAFMDRGGNLCVFRDPEINSLPNLDGYLADWGIAVTDQIVLEPRQQMDSPLNIIPNFGVSMINVYFSEHAAYLVLPECRALELSNANASITNTVLRSTSASYAKEFSSMSSLTQSAEDASGPFTVAATGERSFTNRDGENDTQYVFAAACTGFYQERYLKTESLGNADLVLQVLSQMTDNEVTLNIPTKNLTADSLSLTRTTIILFGAFFVVLLPLSLMLIGLWVFLKRRHS
ncbi:GldG family protein [Oscillibacter sp.]|uniref:GldG family protein n=1 Tax=Oscillibacter sp. TaxID=1945593 RepID=UPI00289A7237|nr:GldG family protein [Oscillibacter sp.]